MALPAAGASLNVQQSGKKPGSTPARGTANRPEETKKGSGQEVRPLPASELE